MLLLLTLCLPNPQDSLRAELVASGLQGPFAVAFDADYTLWFVEFQGHRLGKLVNGKPVYLAGTGTKGNSDGGDTKIGEKLIAQFNAPHNLAVAPDGLIYVADTLNHLVRVFDPKTQFVSTIAGIGQAGFAGDGGPMHKAQFNETYHVALDPSGKNLFIVDLKNQRIRKIDLTTRIVSTVAGNGKKGQPVEGNQALQSPLNDPRAVVVDASGQLFILQRGGNDLWKVDLSGKLHRLAGTGKKGYSGDGGLAREAQFNGPKHLCLDQQGNILIADTENHCIRRVLVKTGMIELVAGRGKGPVPGDALNIELKQPHGVTVHPGTQEIYIADSSNNRIVRLVKHAK